MGRAGKSDQHRRLWRPDRLRHRRRRHRAAPRRRLTHRLHPLQQQHRRRRRLHAGHRPRRQPLGGHLSHGPLSQHDSRPMVCHAEPQEPPPELRHRHRRRAHGGTAGHRTRRRRTAADRQRHRPPAAADYEEQRAAWQQRGEHRGRQGAPLARRLHQGTRRLRPAHGPLRHLRHATDGAGRQQRLDTARRPSRTPLGWRALPVRVRQAVAPHHAHRHAPTGRLHVAGPQRRRRLDGLPLLGHLQVRRAHAPAEGPLQVGQPCGTAPAVEQHQLPGRRPTGARLVQHRPGRLLSARRAAGAHRLVRHRLRTDQHARDVDGRGCRRQHLRRHLRRTVPLCCRQRHLRMSRHRCRHVGVHPQLHGHRRPSALLRHHQGRRQFQPVRHHHARPPAGRLLHLAPRHRRPAAHHRPRQPARGQSAADPPSELLHRRLRHARVRHARATPILMPARGTGDDVARAGPEPPGQLHQRAARPLPAARALQRRRRPVGRALGAQCGHHAAVVSCLVGPPAVDPADRRRRLCRLPLLSPRAEHQAQGGDGGTREGVGAEAQRRQDELLHQHDPRVAHARIPHHGPAGAAPRRGQAHRPGTTHLHGRHPSPCAETEQPHQPRHRLPQGGRRSAAARPAAGRRRRAVPPADGVVCRPVPHEAHRLQPGGCTAGDMARLRPAEAGAHRVEPAVERLQIYGRRRARRAQRQRGAPARRLLRGRQRHRHRPAGATGHLRPLLPLRARQAPEPAGRRPRTGLREAARRAARRAHQRGEHDGSRLAIHVLYPPPAVSPPRGQHQSGRDATDGCHVAVGRVGTAVAVGQAAAARQPGRAPLRAHRRRRPRRADPAGAQPEPRLPRAQGQRRRAGPRHGHRRTA